MLTSIISTVALLASAVTAQTQINPFYVYSMQVFEMRIPYVQHNISFNLNAPNATFKDGGDNQAGCAIGWFEGNAPTCWTRCTSRPSNTSASNPSSTYYARLDDYNGVDQFNVSIWQGYNGHHNTGLVQVRSGKDGYYCSHGAQTNQCSLGFPFKPIQVPATKYSSGCEPTGYPICSS